jgi:hypothetical protein
MLLSSIARVKATWSGFPCIFMEKKQSGAKDQSLAKLFSGNCSQYKTCGPEQDLVPGYVENDYLMNLTISDCAA